MFVDIPNHLATWLILFIFFALASRGLGTLGEVLRSTGMFLLEKALGPAIDFAEGKPGSAARTWIVLSSLWLFVAVCFTFLGIWVGHDQYALISLSGWGYNPSSSTLIAAGTAVGLYGSVAMAVIGASFHVLPSLCGTPGGLPSERNGTLVAAPWTLGVIILFIAAHNPDPFGIDITLAAITVMGLAYSAIAVNLLIAFANRTQSPREPGWLLILAIVAGPVSVLVEVLMGDTNPIAEPWLVLKLYGAPFFLWSVSALALYSAALGSRSPLWSRTLSGTVLMGLVITTSAYQSLDGGLFSSLITQNASIPDVSDSSRMFGTFLVALSLAPMLALSANIIATIRTSGKSPEITNGMAILVASSFSLVILWFLNYSFRSPSFAGFQTYEPLLETVELMTMWLFMIPMSMGIVLHLYPTITNRTLPAPERTRQGYWMFVTAVSAGLLCILISESILLSVTEIDIEATSSLAERFAVIGSVLFYGAVVAVTLHTLNIVRGLFHGKILQNTSQSSRRIESYTITSSTSIRSVLAAGADVETVLVPASDTDVPGAPTEL
ncbi:MAG TPA: hypothetical protein D7I12_05850 [Candidatus Poseidoniales archaeon]|nr:MAG TPA: hypothetical protein D7I12_05850 [Candidatus Poseidoniales archaeon]